LQFLFENSIVGGEKAVCEVFMPMRKSAFLKAMIEVVSGLLKDEAHGRTPDNTLAAVYARNRGIVLASDRCPDGQNPVVEAAMRMYREATKSNKGVPIPLLAHKRLEMEEERAWEHYQEQSKPRVNQHD
jgi:hypothetical protein